MMLSSPSHSMRDDSSISRPTMPLGDYEASRRNVPISQEHSQPPRPPFPSPSQHLAQQPLQSPSVRESHHRHHVSSPTLPSLPPISSSPNHPPPPSWTRNKSPPTPVPPNPFSSTAYRSSTPPMWSSAEQSPLVSPAKRFSTGEVKPLPFCPTSPRQPITEKERQKFNQVRVSLAVMLIIQLATQLRTRLTYAAIKVEHGWEKHSLSQIQDLLNKNPSSPTTRKRSHTIHDSRQLDSQFEPPSSIPQTQSQPGNLTYESFWANHSQRTSTSQPRSSSSQPLFHATFPRRRPERLSLTTIASPASSSLQSPRSAHTARDQSAAEIMIALASPRTRSEFSSPERDHGLSEDDDAARTSPSPRRVRKRGELAKQADGLGIRDGE
jgi:Whi5 like